jgi:hypothetical protein
MHMTQAYNGMPAQWVAGAQWRASGYGDPEESHLELAGLDDGEVAVRMSGHADGPALICTAAELAAFVRAVKDGHFDDLLGSGSQLDMAT